MGAFHFCQILSVLNVRMSESEYQCQLQRQNQNMITESNIIGFSNLVHLQIFLFFIFLLDYLTILMANVTIMTVFIWIGLCTPLCTSFSLASPALKSAIHLSLYQNSDQGLSTSLIICFSGYVSQLYFSVGLAWTNCFLIAVMSYDCYIAICNPFNYTLIVSWATCMQLV